jgi:WD40 repeat protein
VSASSDGSCIIWDLTACRRRQSLFANTFFLAVVYHPDESQIVTAGTDRKVCRTFVSSTSHPRFSN